MLCDTATDGHDVPDCFHSKGIIMIVVKKMKSGKCRLYKVSTTKKREDEVLRDKFSDIMTFESEDEAVKHCQSHYNVTPEVMSWSG